ncbi:MAG: hypothetical protein WA708_03010 [Acidobacteriaceae bacterium]
MPTLRLDIDETEFKQHLVATLTRGGVKLHNAVRTAIQTGISQQLDQLVAAGTCLRYGFKNGNQSRVVSLQGAVERNGFDFWYLDLQVDLRPGIMLSEREVMPPSVMQWLPIDYGGGIQKTFKFKHITMKTRERYEIQLLHPQVPAKVLKAVLQQFGKNCACSSQHLVPFPTPVWEWQQAFGCVLCGTRYFCECFRTAISKSQESEALQNCGDTDFDEAQESVNTEHPVRYRAGICHLCTGAPSDLFYCHPMYGSAIKVRYGAYIEKFAIAENLSARDAENKVRDILDVPRIGEGWINETQLFKLVKMLFADYEVVREARTDWLGSQRIDIFIPALSVAIEYQGEQHFRPVALLCLLARRRATRAGHEDGARCTIARVQQPCAERIDLGEHHRLPSHRQPCDRDGLNARTHREVSHATLRGFGPHLRRRSVSSAARICTILVLRP